MVRENMRSLDTVRFAFCLIVFFILISWFLQNSKRQNMRTYIELGIKWKDRNICVFDNIHFCQSDCTFFGHHIAFCLFLILHIHTCIYLRWGNAIRKKYEFANVNLKEIFSYYPNLCIKTKSCFWVHNFFVSSVKIQKILPSKKKVLALKRNLWKKTFELQSVYPVYLKIIKQDAQLAEGGEIKIFCTRLLILRSDIRFCCKEFLIERDELHMQLRPSYLYLKTRPK